MSPRKLKRMAAKDAYKKFCKQWSLVKEQMKASKPEQQMRKKPSFAEWFKTVQNVPKFDATPEEVKEHLDDLSWE